MKKIIAHRTILIVICAVLVLGFIGYKIIAGRSKNSHTFEQVSLAAVLQEVSEEGTVEISDKIETGFKTSGRIKKIYVKKGEEISAGQPLVELDASQLYAQLAESRAALQIAGEKEANAQVSLQNLRQKLNNVEAQAETSLANVYGDAIVALEDAHLKIYNAYAAVNSFKQTYFSSVRDFEGSTVSQNFDSLGMYEKQAKTYLEEAKEQFLREGADYAILKMEEILQKTVNSLQKVRDVGESTIYDDIISDADKTILDTQKLNVNSALAGVVDARQNISAQKVKNKADINAAESDFSELENQLQGGKVSLYQAQINQAQAAVSSLEDQIRETVLINPVDGQVADVAKTEGETVQAAEMVVMILPRNPEQVKVDIYEEDITEVKVGQPVQITLVAFPGETLMGTVVSIAPSEKVIDDVVYYEVTIDFEDYKQGIKPGMTADVVIETARKENVLAIPTSVLNKQNGKTFVQVLEGSQIKDKEIEVGLTGTNGFTEVLSGLKEGDKIVSD